MKKLISFITIQVLLLIFLFIHKSNANKLINIKTAMTISNIELNNNDDVQKWITYFTKNNREWFQQSLTRGSKYEKNIKNMLATAGLPKELFYIALIESGFQQKAKSPLGARGFWQFMRGTALIYGLNISKHTDERLHIYKSTASAIAYLKDLYNIYGSWPLALASYNAGEFRIRRAILKHGKRNFFDLSKQNALPQETQDYVPKFIASVIISKDPVKYGFLSTKKITEEDSEEYKKLLLSMNQYKRGSKKSIRIIKRKKHLVRKGDNLSMIAYKYNTTARKIRRCNSLQSSNLRIGQRLKLACGAV